MSDKRYSVAAIQVQDEIVIAYCPDAASIYLTDLVCLDDGRTGRVIITDDCEPFARVHERARMLDGKMHKIVKAYLEKKVEWEEEENGEAV